MKLNPRIALFACFLLTFAASYAQLKSTPNPVLVTSPDGKLVLSVSAPGGTLQYTVQYGKATVIEGSRLGLVVNGKLLGTDAATGETERYKLNETYPYRGVHSTAVNKCNGARININSSSPFTLEARVFNDGAAFRYLVKNAGDALVEKDTTGFVFPSGSVAWWQGNIKYYEGKYGKKKIEEFQQGDLAGPPVTVELPSGLYAAITEGGLTDFAGMSLRADGANGFNANLTGATQKAGNIQTPWRIIEVGKDLNTLVNSDIVASVSPASDKTLFPKGYNTGWLKPGRSVWSWLATARDITLENMKHFSDLAAQLGFEYNLVDEGWGNWKDSAHGRDGWDMMKELVDYSAKKGVKIWVWKAYPDRGGIAGINSVEKRNAFFKRCRDIGIVGLKIDFFDSEAQDIIRFYQAALHDAAAYRLMIDFHGANKPTGEARTWPNEMTREAIRGLENRAPWAPSNTVLPFTRYLAGHADFTPVHFGNRLGEVSWAHHVATAVVFTSPFLCYGADPQSILDNPGAELIKRIPSTWDETIVLPQSKIGELVVYARRTGGTWFLAAMNGLHEAKTVTVGLSFLKGGTYKLSLMKDDPGKQASAILENKTVAAAASLTIELNAEGGFAGWFEKVK